MLSPSPVSDPRARISALARKAFRRPGQPRITLRAALYGAGATIVTLGILGVLGSVTGSAMLVAGFASSCVLAYMLPGAPLAHPFNVMGGHLIAGLVGIAARFLLPGGWPTAIAAVVVSMLIMALLGVLHPPAGGTPLAIALATDGWQQLLVPVLVGAVIIGLCTYGYAALARLHSPSKVA